MDTGTHFIMGIGLFGLAHLDPAVASDPHTASAILFSTVVGSQLPDLDSLYRLKGNSAYIRNHRGWTHSFPMILVWPTLLTFILSYFFPEANLLHTWLWGLLAVFIHVFIDLFNAYGTQALKPIYNRWISWNIISIFDPFIFMIHVIGIALWVSSLYPPGLIFLSVYLVLIIYVSWRTYVHYSKLRWLKKQVNKPGKYTLLPTARWNNWKIILELEDMVLMGEIHERTINWTGRLSKKDLTHPAAIHSKQTESIEAFLSFTSYGFPKVFQRPYGYEVRWYDVRYHYKKRFPFVAVALLDENFQPIDSYVGWQSEERIDKKVHHMLS
jgi:inner membrane protein